MDVKLLVIFDLGDGILVHGHPLGIAVAVFLFVTRLAVTMLFVHVGVCWRTVIVLLLDINPVLLVLGEVFVTDLAAALQLVHMGLHLMVELGASLENILK